ncbi:MAG TPA: Rieske 2Fe-2S domain-containing protein [Candidatus Methylomirabilis sp.]|nr:Rieske 2Fe-2S domain-containing protein [Candidatus Methylomirabilis sp.]
MAFLRAANKADIPPGQIREIRVNGTSVAVANVDGKFFAINSVCLHHGGPLGEGELEGKMVTCPWHGWQYDVTTGKLVQQPSDSVQCYAVEMRGEDVFVDLGEPAGG